MQSKIQTIAVIGAGLRGRMIAHAALRGGYRVVLEDVSTEALSDALAWMRSAGSEAATAIANLSRVSSVEAAVREADLIIEAAAEEMEVKIELFTIFDKFAKPNAILSSSSASLPISEMAAVTFCADRCIGMRFSGPGPSDTITLIMVSETSADTVANCAGVARQLSRDVTVVREQNGGTEVLQLKSAAATR